ncbi:Excinuclease ABC, C subunit [Prunus dulcis]|uniref:Excinuclease ABC, C subunit n=1 Tax=Prunus dulcis TaxID=3755 RepID=A0A4Y1RMR3_PRUDU|nr:Excinuclease ABC, C subunit [Prunus dulcis]
MDLNCIKEGLIPTKYYIKSTESLRTASGKSLQLNYEIPKAHKNAELERGSPRLVINYKPLNSVLEWIRYPIPNKRDLIKRLDKAVGFWQIQIHESDRYKTAFVTPFGHYEWNVMPFGLKNAPSEFQNIMNEIFNTYSHFSIVYIDDVLIFSESIEQHWKHLHTFLHIIKTNGLVVSAKKIKLFQTTNPPPWSSIHTDIVLQIKRHVKTLPCLGIPTSTSFKIVETDASDIGYGGILKQKSESDSSEQINIERLSPSPDRTLSPSMSPLLLRILSLQLKDLAQQLLLRASQMHDDDAESETSSSCQPAQPTPERPVRWADYLHGQDPNDAYDEAYKAYDLNSD